MSSWGDAREVDPALSSVPALTNAHLRQREHIAAGADVTAEDRKPEGANGCHDDIRFCARWEVDDESAGIDSEFDLEICGGGGGLGRGFDFGFVDVGRGSSCVSGGSWSYWFNARNWYAENNDVHSEECSDQAAAVMH